MTVISDSVRTPEVLRISETIALDLDDIDSITAQISIITVTISDIALDDLLSYLAVRKEIYRVSDQQKALFLSLPTGPQGIASRLNVNLFLLKYVYINRNLQKGMTHNKFWNSTKARLEKAKEND
ncbi:hypothetical protein [Paenibacillus xylanivorans]|nr:hypothetical protein [Paenibacillus xylanivorans]